MKAYDVKIDEKFCYGDKTFTRKKVGDMDILRSTYEPNCCGYNCIAAIDSNNDIHLIKVSEIVKSLNTTKQFKVASVSEYANSFGFYGMILVAEDGETWQVSIRNKKEKVGDILNVEIVQGRLQWHTFGFEAPMRYYPNRK